MHFHVIFQRLEICTKLGGINFYHDSLNLMILKISHMQSREGLNLQPNRATQTSDRKKIGLSKVKHRGIVLIYNNTVNKNINGA